MTPDLPMVLTIEEVARTLRISRSAAYEAVRRGEIPSVRIGRTLRVPRHRILELIGGEGSDGNGGPTRDATEE